MRRAPHCSVVRVAWGTAFIFAFVFNVELAAGEGLSLASFALFAGFIVLICKGHTSALRGQRTLLAAAMALPALYIATMQSLLRATDASTLAALYVKTLLFVLLGGVVFQGLFLRRLEPRAGVDFLLKCVVWAFVLQAGFVFLSFLNPGFREFTDALLTAKGNLTGLEGFRVKGFANSGGANLSMAMCFASMMSMYLSLRGEGRRYVVAALVIIAASTLVGRSGILGFGIATIFFGLYVLATGSFSRIKLMGSLLLAITLIIGVQVALGDLDESAQLWWDWFSGQAGDSVGDVLDMYAHDFSFKDLLLGKGYFETETSGNDRSDVGYLKTLFSVGLPAGLLFYAGLLMLYVHGARAFVAIERGDAAARVFVVLTLLLVFFFESKEAMAYQNFTGRMMLFSFVVFASLKGRLSPRSQPLMPPQQRCAE